MRKQQNNFKFDRFFFFQWLDLKQVFVSLPVIIKSMFRISIVEKMM